MATEHHRTFLDALESLPDGDRQLLALHELDGLNAEGIGRALGISCAEARVGILRARLAMRTRLFDLMRSV